MPSNRYTLSIENKKYTSMSSADTFSSDGSEKVIVCSSFYRLCMFLTSLKARKMRKVRSI